MGARIKPNGAFAFALATWMREHRKPTVRQYAKHIGVSDTTVYRWLSGQIDRPQALHWVVVAKEFGVDYDMPQAVGFAPFKNLTDPGHSLGSGLEDMDVTQLLRRDLLTMAAAAFFAPALYPQIAKLLDVDSRVRIHVGASDVARLAEKTRVIQSNIELGDGAVMGRSALMTEFERGVRLIKGTFASDRVRAQAHGAAATFTKYIGWNLYDQGFHDDARRMWITALAIAREADPSVAPLIQAHVFQDMAIQANDMGEPQKALDLLGMLSGREADLPSLLRANLSLMRARASSVLGKVDETRRHIGWAEDHINDAADERDATAWNINGWFNQADMNGLAGHAMTTLAVDHGYQRDEALSHATVALATYSADRTISRARVANTVVRLHAANRDVAETEQAGVVALETARKVKSPRIMGELLAIRPYLEPMTRKHAGVRELDHGIYDLVRKAVV